MALPLLPLLLSTGVRQVAKKGVSTALKYANRALTGSMIVDSVNEASKGNYEGLTDIAQFSIMGRMNKIGPIRKLDSFVATKGLEPKVGNTAFQREIVARKKDMSKPTFEKTTGGPVNTASGGSIAKPRTINKTPEPRREEVSKASRGGQMVAVDKDGNLANYSRSVGTGGAIRGQILKDGKPTGQFDYRKDHPQYKSMIADQRRQQISNKKAEAFNIRKSIADKNELSNTYIAYKKTLKSIDRETKEIETKFAKPLVAKMISKGDKVNRLFTSTTDSDMRVATIVYKEASKQGVKLDVITKPSDAQYKHAKRFVSANTKYAEVGASGVSGKGQSLMKRDINQEAMLRTMMNKKISKSGSSIGEAYYVKASGPTTTRAVKDSMNSLKSRVENIGLDIAKGEQIRNQKFRSRPPTVGDKINIEGRPTLDSRQTSTINPVKIKKYKKDRYVYNQKTGSITVQSNIPIPVKGPTGKRKYSDLTNIEMTLQVGDMRRLKVNLKEGSITRPTKPKK